MRFKTNEIVVSQENKATIERILNVTQPHDTPELLYVCGPANSGKSTILDARGNEKDLLSTKRALYCHSAEILITLGIDNDNAFDFLTKIGGIEVLLIDDIEGFLKKKGLGSEACRLLIKNRTQYGLDTVVAARTPFAMLDENLQKALAGFEEIDLAPLDEEACISLAKSYALHFTHIKGDQHTNQLSEDTFAFLGHKFWQNPHQLEPAVEFLVTVADFPEGVVVDAQSAEEAISL